MLDLRLDLGYQLARPLINVSGTGQDLMDSRGLNVGVLLPGRLAVAYDSQGASCPIGPAASETCLKGVAGRYGVESILKVAISREDQTLRIEVMLLDLQVDDVAASASAAASAPEKASPAPVESTAATGSPGTR